MGKRIWLKFNLFIYSPEIRYKSDSTILLQDDESRSGPFAAVDFVSTPMATSLSKYFFEGSRWMTGMGKARSW